MRAVFLALCFFLLPVSASAEQTTLKIGSLPAGDSLILHVGVESGFFKNNGLDVKIVPFQSALELGAAMRAGNLDGHFGDILNVLMQNENGAPQRIVATTSHSSPTQRFFGLIVSPRSKAQTLDELNGTDVAIASSTIVDYLLSSLLEKEGKPANFLVRQDIRQIPIRMQMLLSGQIESAFLPEPLVSFLETKGARVILDDRKLNEPLAVIALRRTVTDGAKGEEITKAFRAALQESAEAINKNPAKYKDVMIQKGLLSKDARDSYAMLTFDMKKTPLSIPMPADILAYSDWMQARKMLKKTPDPADVLWQSAQ